MKTEEFDDAVRKKLDSINSPFKESDIDNVHDYVIGNRSARFRKRYGLLLISTLGLLMIAGSITWNFIQQNQKETFLHTIDSLRNNLKQSEARHLLTKTDTVYIKEYINNTGSHAFNDNQSFENARRNSMASLDPKLLTKTDKKITSQINESLNQKKNKPGLDTGDKLKSTHSDNIVQVDQKGKSNTGIKKNTQVIFIKQDSVINAFDSSNTNDLILNSTDSIKINKVSPSKWKENVKYQAGFEFEYANGPLGYSILGGILLNNKWNLNTGLKLMTINNERYDDEDDYNSSNGQDFQDIYYITDTSYILNIEIQNTIIQIPVSLNYHLYLKNNFNLIFGLGSDFDIYSKQEVVYRNLEANYKEERKYIEIKNSPQFFNNIEFIFGIRKKFDHFTFQADPFVSWQVKNVAYKKEDIYYGLNLGMFYLFGK